MKIIHIESDIMVRLIYILFPFAVLTAYKSNQTQDAGEPVRLNIMSFNIRYDNPEDGPNNWKYRKDVAAQIVKNEDIDLLGTQEVLFNQLEDLEARLPGYVALGVGREDGVHKGEHSAIFYKKDRFKQIDYGNFWLSQRPDTVSIGWDAALERIATWVVLEEKKSGKQFFFMNTHFDHRGKVARLESGKLILKRVAELSRGLPVILTGDFNASPETPVVKGIDGADVPGHLMDSREIAEKVGGDETTFHDFKDDATSKWAARIDYIFVNNQVEVHEYKALPKKLNNIFLSDHVPIEAKVSLK